MPTTCSGQTSIWDPKNDCASITVLGVQQDGTEKGFNSLVWLCGKGVRNIHMVDYRWEVFHAVSSSKACTGLAQTNFSNENVDLMWRQRSCKDIISLSQPYLECLSSWHGSMEMLPTPGEGNRERDWTVLEALLAGWEGTQILESWRERWENLHETKYDLREKWDCHNKLFKSAFLWRMA